MGKATCICWLLFIVLSASLVVTLITLDYVGVKPRFYIQEIYIPALNNPHTYNATNLNTSIIINLKFKRVVTYVPLRYKDVTITLYYASNRSSGPVGYAVVPGFSQHRKKTAHRRAVVEARALPWEDAFEKISGGSTVALTAELTTRYRLKRCNKILCYYTKARAVVVAADLQVDASGAEVSNNPIRLH